ncbi:VanZ family protein [Corynebacterium crudilactis]|uniref:VanZ-like domain-containing protein n=1 Tax=Corynebacterium crudilactis TaxID=1652495 RepID=A0A172QWV1_9CORY|nr:VanZ family protein [Corynebacterium crudilactis]ANE05131.1 hypothetical protein ccrud_13600 [Corynebacterium crudilactis]
MSTTHASGIQVPQAPQQSHHTTRPGREGKVSWLLFSISFGVYVVLLVMMTLLKNRLSLGGLWNTEAHQFRSIDLELFNGFVDAPIWWGPWTNTFGNIALFIPFGFFLYTALRKLGHRFPFVETVLFAGLSSLIIEVLQWVFAVGYSDVDDLLCNSIGGMIGAVVAVCVPVKASKVISGIVMAGSLSVMAMMLYSSMAI